MENIEPRYAYFTVPSAIPGFVCVRLERAKGTKHCRASFSFCSPQDSLLYRDGANRYSFQRYKLIARKIADSRAATKRVKATIEFDCEGPMGDAFRRALQLATTTERPYHKRSGKVCKGVHRPGKPPTIAPRWFREAGTVEFGLCQPSTDHPNRMDRGDPPA